MFVSDTRVDDIKNDRLDRGGRYDHCPLINRQLSGGMSEKGNYSGFLRVLYYRFTLR
ncbi:hypothetical protein PLGE761_15870 [Pluralibacter gergoviae]|uniref:hypothetical protein n=1 Tax=Pluralibacter gergoviae TaxID=61647 RepID=UPI000A54DF98|nr:hypothetical protein [Pluralibacter gergoviae]SUB71421.1 Uncharacterised protein [Pluralibacter gergoviae]